MARPIKKEAIASKKEFEFKDRVYLLKGNSTPISYMLRSKHSANKPLLYFDQEFKVNRALRWSDNQTSPFIDEQDGYAIATPIIFENGSLYVKKEQVELQKFLSIYHPDNNNAYYEFDAEEKASEEYDELTAKLDAQNTVREMPIEDLEAIARVLLKGKVELMTSSELRRDMLIFASKNPQEFTSLVNDDSIKFRNIAIRAVQMDIINVSSDGRTVNWSGKDGGRIITVPFGENAYSALAAFFLTDQGMDVLSDISNKL
ncbi:MULTISPECIES: hypothetical protein [Flavobacteriaceae]|uniref:hypothetical protein n=1 Tax=Flavobacteriaceae TaxID=49546 RepID=UPI0025EF3FF6|nr:MULTISPECIES: hypothetical protein [Flavobacteriaceae]